MKSQTKPKDSYYCYASNFQTLPINDFPSSLEWSNDAQAFAISRANIHLFTPSLGYLIPPNAHQQNSQQNLSSSTDHALQDPPPSTPGSTTNTPSVTAQSQSASSIKSSARPHQIPMFATMIEIKKQFGHDWSAHSNDLHIITPPNDDRFWRAASWSPSGLSSLGSCLLAALTTTCDVFIFSPCHNAQSGLWEMGKRKKNLSEELLYIFFKSYSTITQNGTYYHHHQREKSITRDREKVHFVQTEIENDHVQIGEKMIEINELDVSPETQRCESKEAQSKRSRFTSCVLRTQTTALSWSPAYSHSSKTSSQIPVENTLQNNDNNTSPSIHAYAFDLGCYGLDFSLLALGHRRGDLSIWRHGSNGDMELVCFKPICRNGLTINLLSWSEWSLCRTPGTVENQDQEEYKLTASLAIANPKGVIYILEISQIFEKQPKSINTSSFESIKFKSPKIEIQTSSVYNDQLNLSSITCMKWIPSFKDNFPLKLVFSRLGEVVFLQVPHKSGRTDGPVYKSGAMNHQIIQLPALSPYDVRLSWPNCHSWASCSGFSILPIKRCYKTGQIQNQIIAMLSNGLIFVLNQTDSNKELKQSIIQCDIQHSIQLSLDFRSKFCNITSHQSNQPGQNQNNVDQISKQNVMKVYGSSVLSTVLHAHDQFDQFDNQICFGASGSIMSWLYEIDSPDKFSYKPENRQILHFSMADFNPIEVSVDIVQSQQDLSPVDRRRSQLIGLLRAQIKILPALFAKPISCIQVSPNLKLMNIFSILHLIFSDLGLIRIPFLSESLSSTLLEFLELLDSHDDEKSESIIYVEQQKCDRSDNNPSFIFLKSYLVQKIFYNHYLDKLRLKFSLISFILNQIDKNQSQNLRTRLVDMKVKTCRLIHKEILKIIAGCFLKYQVRLTENEKSIMNKYQFASKVIERMPEPTLEQLLEPEEIDHKLLDEDRLSSSSFLPQTSSSPSLEAQDGFNADEDLSILLKQESCPACPQPIHFDSLRFAVCKTGHVWDRCSVTFEILSTMELKICTNCGRKSFNNNYNKRGRDFMDVNQGGGDRSSNQDSDSIFLDIFLDSFIRCLHCGGGWKFFS